MPTRFIDLSICLENDVVSDPPFMRPRIAYKTHLEKPHNLEALPPSGFTVSCFPHKIKGASAGWTRAVAILGD